VATADPRDPRPAAAGADAVSRLLSRPPPPGYLEAWAERIREPAATEDVRHLSIGVVRLGEELFALETRHVVEVRPLARIRTVPGRTHDVFRGLVSLRGVIHLAASLHALLGIEAPPPSPAAALLVVERRDPGAAPERWALVVDAVLGFERVDPETVAPAQVTVTKSSVHFTDGVLATPYGAASRIDAARLFDGLDRSLA
jgi:chemotaxis signal transduction protein